MPLWMLCLLTIAKSIITHALKNSHLFVLSHISDSSDLFFLFFSYCKCHVFLSCYRYILPSFTFIMHSVNLPLRVIKKKDHTYMKLVLNVWVMKEKNVYFCLQLITLSYNKRICVGVFFSTWILLSSLTPLLNYRGHNTFNPFLMNESTNHG